KTLGTTGTAIVQSVRCRRILLARKTMFFSKRRITKSEAINGVAHLTQLSHAHILQVIGTYVIGNKLSILLYPVTEDNLKSFLDHMSKYCEETSWENFGGLYDLIESYEQFVSCLAKAIEYIHSAFTKHMYIKPRNLLVKAHPRRAYRHIYIADFGISRSYQNMETSNTDGPTSYTFKYAAPEVVSQDQRGLSADIFSLGCVYFEIYEAL
ncbi:kinase-like protein, partial [Lizonia empirigonia]